MSSYLSRKFHCGDKTILPLNGISYTDKMIFDTESGYLNVVIITYEYSNEYGIWEFLVVSKLSLHVWHGSLWWITVLIQPTRCCQDRKSYIPNKLKSIFESFWETEERLMTWERSYCAVILMHPRRVGLSLLPLSLPKGVRFNQHPCRLHAFPAILVLQFWCWGRIILGELCQCHGFWCSGSVGPQVVSGFAIEYIEYTDSGRYFMVPRTTSRVKV